MPETELPPPSGLRPSEQLCALLGVPAPPPPTEEETAEFRRWMAEADAAQDALNARRAQQQS